MDIRAKEIRMVPIGEIKLNPKNYNKHPKDQIDRLCKLIDYQGFRVPVVVSNRSGVLIAGEGRYLAAKQLGLKELPVIFQDFDTADQEVAFGVSDNAIGIWADLDLSMINTDIGELGPDFDIDLLGIKNFTIDVSEKMPEPPIEPRFQDRTSINQGIERYRLFYGDCLERLRELPDDSVDSIVTDPPYGLSFMGKGWDYDVPSVEIWRECLRVLRPGGHVLSFSGTRTYHRMVVNMEDAGFEIRDQLAWLYGQGFPKSMDISKAIDSEAGFEREIVGQRKESGPDFGDEQFTEQGSMMQTHLTAPRKQIDITTPTTPAAKAWSGWGTALKPALEPICLARKPLSEQTVAANVRMHGTGALNIDESRIGCERRENKPRGTAGPTNSMNSLGHGPGSVVEGRWPANVILDEDAATMLDEQSGFSKSTKLNCIQKSRNDSSQLKGIERERERVNEGHEDSGGASRFFYVAKTSKRERNDGLEGMPTASNGGGDVRLDGNPVTQHQNHHPTVKPSRLMQYLIKLVTPSNGIVLDPFMGSGSTGVAAMRDGFIFFGCEMTAEYFEIAKRRIQHALAKPDAEDDDE